MSVSTNYEVHTLKGGRWVVDSTYQNRETALDLARPLHGEKQFEGIKVIRDTYDRETDAARETVIYDSSKPVKDKAAPAEPDSKEAVESGPKADVDFKGGSRPTPKKTSDHGVALKAVLWLVAILVAGLGILFLVTLSGHHMSKWF